MEAVWWRRVNSLVIAVAGILAAVSGGSTLAAATSGRVSGAIALAAAAMSALAVGLSGGSRASEYEMAANSDTALADAASVFVKTLAPYLAMSDVVRHFEILCAHRDRVVATSPPSYVPWARRQRRRLSAVQQ